MKEIKLTQGFVALVDDQDFEDICHEYRSIYIGRFENETEAALAYNLKAIELFGEFAVLNEV